MFNHNTGPELTKPQYNSTLKIIKQIEDVQASTDCNLKINDAALEKINEKASAKLNFKDEVVFDGLIKIKPAEEDFLSFLRAKHGLSVKPQINSTKKDNQRLTDIQDFFPSDLQKEYPGVEIDTIKVAKQQTIKISTQITQEPIRSHFRWN